MFDPYAARSTLHRHAKRITTFVRYANGSGSSRLREAVAADLGHDTATQLIDGAFDCLISNDSTSLEDIVAGAPSFAFLVSYAGKLSPTEFAGGLVPPDEVVDAALGLFYNRN